MSVFGNDKVKVFISSTIRECATERKVAKDAILSLNHAPILFEDFGARPLPPREMYLRGIEESHIFIAIYKESRGWVSDNMEVSGLEDEFRHASRRGMPRLVYMQDASGSLPPWLGNLTDIMEREKVSVCFFKDTQELFDRIRDDVEAVVASTFFSRSPVELQLPSTPTDILTSLLPETGKRLRRREVERNLLETLSSQSNVLVYGPMGIGKTILLAQLSEAHGFLFLPATGLTDKEFIGTAARVLQEKSGRAISRYLDLASASSSFMATWRDVSDFTLVVDDCDDPCALLNLINKAGGSSQQKRLMVSTRATSALPGFFSFDVPPLSQDEIRTFLRAHRSGDVPPAEFQEIVEHSLGNPLYLRYYVHRPAGHHLPSIEDYEKDHWLLLKSKPKELVTYVVLADRPLAFGALKDLLSGSDASVEEFDVHLAATQHLLREDRQGYTVVHEHLRQTIRSLLRDKHAKHAYYANRLANQFERDGDYAGAYLVLDRANDPKARRYLHKASYQAQINGDVKTSIHTLKERLKHGVEATDSEDRVLTLLALSQAQTQSGDQEAALQSLAAAMLLAQRLGDMELSALLEEQKALLEARSTADVTSVHRLEKLKDLYEQRGNTWASARISVSLSEVHVRLKAYRDAAREAEAALRHFEAIQDEHGVSVSKRNLVAALNMTPGEEGRAAQFLQEIRDETDTQMNERERAWVYNVLSVQSRRAGDPAAALSYAEQAIQLGLHLGDHYVVAINRIAAGNALRDAKKYEEATAQYELTARIAQQSGFRELEASANELVASVLNRQQAYAKAEHYARYAAGLVRGTAAVHTFANAMDELGKALLGRRELKEGARAYLEGARSLAGNDNYKERFYHLAMDGFDAVVDIDDFAQYVEYLDQCFSLNVPASTDEIESLFNRVPRLLHCLDDRHLILVMGVHFRKLFQGLPSPAAKFLLGRLLNAILGTAGRESVPRPLLSLIPLLAAVPADALTISDIVNLGEKLFHASDSISFKPHQDGAAHWVVRLNFATPVTCSIQQLDDRVDTALVSMFLALFLKGFESEIQQEIILSPILPRRELAIAVVNLGEFTQHVMQPPHELDFPADAPCTVTRPTDPKDPDRVPTVVICRNDISKNWHAGRRQGSALQFLFGRVLLEVIYQLFEGQVDMESLSPNIVSVVHRSMS